MSEQGDTSAPPPAPMPAPTGLDAVKAKALQVGIKAYMAAPPPVQKATITVISKAHPVVARTRPYAKKLLAGSAAVVVVRKITRRSS